MKVCLIAAATATDFEDAEEARSPQVRALATAPHLGVLTLASVLRGAGVGVSVVNLNRAYYEYLDQDGGGLEAFAGWAAGRILSSDADLYGFSSICNSYPLSIRIAGSIKQRRPDCTVLFGGPHSSAVDIQTMAAFPCVDFILRGEADESLLLFLEEWRGERRYSAVPGLTWRSSAGPVRNGQAPLIADLDSLPLPAYDLDGGLAGVKAAPVELGRGCPFACTFCSTNEFFRRKFRVKSPPRMLADMRAIASTYGLRKFDLTHDMFAVDRKRVVAFCECMIQSGEKFRWACSARTDCVDDELLELMAAAGCYGIFFGVETGSRRMQKIIGKELDPDRAKVIIDTAERLGIHTTVSVIAGFPEETWTDLRETAGMYMHAMRQPDCEPQFNLLAPLAGTAIHKKYKAAMVLEELCSAESHQGRLQNAADRELIRRHPEIFPNFYLLPTPDLDRACCLELREFLLMGCGRLRLLLTALHQAGSGILDVFLRWREYRRSLRGESSGGALRHYYTQDLARDDFLEFVQTRIGELASPAVEAALAYYAALSEARRARFTPPGKRVSGAIELSDVPLRKPYVDVLALDCDMSAVIEYLRGALPCFPAAERKYYRTKPASEGAVQVAEIAPLLFRALEICDGRRTADECITEMAACFDCPPELARLGGERLLEGVREQGLIEFYRPGVPEHRSELHFPHGQARPDLRTVPGACERAGG